MFTCLSTRDLLSHKNKTYAMNMATQVLCQEHRFSAVLRRGQSEHPQVPTSQAIPVLLHSGWRNEREYCVHHLLGIQGNWQSGETEKTLGEVKTWTRCRNSSSFKTALPDKRPGWADRVRQIWFDGYEVRYRIPLQIFLTEFNTSENGGGPLTIYFIQFYTNSANG